MASSEASTEEGAGYELTRKHLYLPSGKRIKVKSPRFLAALAENGVILAELEEPLIDPFYEKARGNWELAEREWGAADATRREKLDLVVGHREARIKAAREETAPKPDSGPPANELLSGASLIALEKEHVAKVLQKRAKKQAFEAAQAEFFAARHNETVKTAHEKHSRAQAFRAQVKANEEAHFDQKRQTFARKQQRAKDGFQRWEENKDEERRQLQRRDAETAARNLELSAQRSFDLLNRSEEFAARVDIANQRGSAILDTRYKQLSDERQRFEQRMAAHAKLTSSELAAQRKAQRAAAEARDIKVGELKKEIARDHLEKLKGHEDKHEAKAQQIERERQEHAAMLLKRRQEKDAYIRDAAERVKRETETEAARIKREARERAARATDNQSRVMAERSSELRTAAMRRTEKSLRLQRVEEHKRFLMQQQVEAKHARLAAIKAQQATLGRRRERAMHVLFLKEQKEAMRSSGATSASPVA